MQRDQRSGRRLTHVNEKGAARMVDVSGKDATVRRAVATAVVRMKPAVLDALMGGGLSKGDALATARIAGIAAAKRTAEWIPLCHTLPLDCVEIEFERGGGGALWITASAKTTARTGVEMEAMVAVSASALTVYDMAKALDRAMVIGPIQLEYKSGGKTGEFRRTPSSGRRNAASS